MKRRVGITGDSGFIGYHLKHTLANVDRVELIEFKRSFFDDVQALKSFALQCDVVVHLAGECRNDDDDELYRINVSLVERLITACSKSTRIVFASSTHEDRPSGYGRSKLKGRQLLEQVADSYTLVIPNVFGPFGKPKHNSVVATFAHAVANGLPCTVKNDAALELIHITELVPFFSAAIFDASLTGVLKVEPVYNVSLTKVYSILTNFSGPASVYTPSFDDNLEVHLYNMLLTYCPLLERYPAKLVGHSDERGSFCELSRDKKGNGQHSFSSTNVGVTRGNHYHTRKAERFVLLSGKALIQMRKVGTTQVLEFTLDSESIVDIPVWYAHSVTNIGDSEMLMYFWTNEHFNEADSDTFYQNVVPPKATSLKRLKVMTVVGTRPEIIRLSRVICALEESTESIEHVLVHTGQNYDYELNEIFFEDLGLRSPDHFLDCARVGGSTLAIASILAAVEPVLEQEAPDAFLILGDTNSCFAALAAKKRRIPVFHMEAGNRCFDQRVPEEVNRRIIDHFSDMNLVYSRHAREHLMREGLDADKVVITGSPMFEILSHYREQIDASEILTQLKLTAGRYFVVSTHRDENVTNNSVLVEWACILNALATTYGYPVIVSTHPRTRNKIHALGLKFDDRIQLLKPMSFSDYNHLQKNAMCVLSDSGTISEESSILKFPALNLRETHERAEAMEQAAVMMVGMNKDRIFQALPLLALHTAHTNDVDAYSVPNLSKNVVRIIMSYVDYVNINTWRK